MASETPDEFHTPTNVLLIVHRQVYGEFYRQQSRLLALVRVPVLLFIAGLLVVSVFDLPSSVAAPRTRLLFGLGVACYSIGFLTAAVGHHRLVGLLRYYRSRLASADDSIESMAEEAAEGTGKSRKVVEKVNACVGATYQFYVTGTLFLTVGVTTALLHELGIPPAATVSVAAFAYIVFEAAGGLKLPWR